MTRQVLDLLEGHREARRGVEDLLHALVASVDGKDVAAALELVGAARVEVRGQRVVAAGARCWLTQLWTDPGDHHHDVTVLAVVPAQDAGRWAVRARYVRRRLGSPPVVHSCGEYELLIDVAEDEDGDGVATLRALTVVPTWTRSP